MKKLMLIIGLVLFLSLTGLAHANLLGDGLVSYWKGNTTDMMDLHDASVLGGADADYGSGKFSNTAWDFDGNGDGVNTFSITSIAQIGNEHDFSVQYWVNADSHNSDFDGLSSHGNADTSGTTGWNNAFASEDSLGLLFRTKDGSGTTQNFNATTMNTGTWYNVIITYNATTGAAKLYWDGTQKDSQTRDPSSFINFDSTFQMGRWSNGESASRDFEGLFSDMAVWNKTLDVGNLTALQTNGFDTFTFPPGPPALRTLNISSPLPPNASQFNLNNLSINMTANSSSIVNATLYVDGKPNQTVTGLPAGTNIPINFTLFFGNGTEVTFNYQINVSNEIFGITAGASNMTVNHTVHIDTVSPNITTNFIENQLYYNANLTGTFNISDTLNLFSYNISIDGDQIDGDINLATTFLQYNLSTNLTSLQPGNHTLTIRAADGHTAEELYKPDDWEINSGLFDSYLEFGTPQDIEITIDTSSSSIWDTFGYEQLLDRYQWTFEPSDYSQTEYIFTVDTNGSYIYIREDDPTYQDYLIIGEHWVDFLLTTEEDEVVEITRLSDTSVIVNVSNILSPEFMEFESIGDLNVNTRNFSFLTTNISVTFTDPVLEGEPFTTVVSWDINGTNLSEDRINLTFFNYNNTNYTGNVTKTFNSHYINFSFTSDAPDISPNTTAVKVFNWSFAGGSVFNGSIVYNHTISAILLDNCSTLPTQTLNFTLVDEVSDLPVNGTLEAYFETYVTDAEKIVSFNLSWSSVPARSEFGVCLFPAYAEYITYAQFQYASPGYATKNYYFPNANLSNETKFINLLLNNASSQIQFTVLNQNDDPLENAYIKVLSYDIGTNSYVISEILKTDTEGIAYGQLVKSSGSDVQWYQFMVEFDYDVKLTTEPSKITEDTRTFRINTVDTYFEQVAKKNSLVTSLTYSNTSGNFNFVFSNPAGTADTYCLAVSKQFINSQSVENLSCTTGSAGSILVAAPDNPDNNSIIATSSVTIGGSLFPLETLQISGSEVFKKFGKTGLFVTFLLTLTLVMVGIWSPAIATVMALIGVSMAVVMQIFMLQWSMIVIFIALGILTVYRINRQ